MSRFLAVLFIFASLNFVGAEVVQAVPPDTALSRVRYGLHDGGLRLVLDMGNRALYAVFESSDNTVSLSIPRLDLNAVPEKVFSSNYPGWITKITAEKSSERPILNITLADGVSLKGHGTVEEPAPYRIFLDFVKSDSKKSSPKPKERKEAPPKTDQAADKKANEAKDEPKPTVATPPSVAPKQNFEEKLERIKDTLASEREEIGKPVEKPTSGKTPELEKQAPGPEIIGSGIKEPVPQQAAITNVQPRENETAAAASGTITKAVTAGRTVDAKTEIKGRKSEAAGNNLISQKIGKYAVLSETEVTQKNYLDRARALYQQKEFQDALNVIDQFKAQFPNSRFNEEVAYLQANCAYMVKRVASQPEKQEVINLYTLALADYPDSPQAPEALYNVGALYLDMTFYYEALSQFNTLATKYPESKYGQEALYWVAECEFQIGKYDEARAQLNKFLSERPDDELAKRATVRLAECYSRLNQHQEADRILKDAFIKWPDLMSALPVDSYYDIANYYLIRQEKDKAEEALLLGANIYPQDPMARKIILKLAELYDENGDTPKTAALCSILINRFPESEEAVWSKLKLADLGERRAEMRLQDTDQAVANYSNSLETLKRVAESGQYHFREEALRKLADAYQKRNDPVRELEALKALALEFSESERIENYRDDAVKAMESILSASSTEQDALRAVRSYETSFKVANFRLTDPSDILKMANSYASLDLINEACELGSQALEKTEKGSDLRRRILKTGAQWFFKKHDLNKAAQWYDQALEETPADKISPEEYITLARWRYKQQRYTQAAELYLKALPTSENSADVEAATAAFELGRLYMDMNFPANAALFFKRAEQLYPSEKSQEGQKNRSEFPSLCNLYLADSLVAQDQERPALSHYRESLQGDLKGNDRAWALYQLANIQSKLGDVKAEREALEELSVLKDSEEWANIGGALLRLHNSSRRLEEVG